MYYAFETGPATFIVMAYSNIPLECQSRETFLKGGCPKFKAPRNEHGVLAGRYLGTIIVQLDSMPTLPIHSHYHPADPKMVAARDWLFTQFGITALFAAE